LRAQREGFHFAAKLVRGAYLVLEQERATQVGYASPIWDSIEQTHENFHRVLDLVLRQSQKHRNVMVATHNQQSIEYTLSKMARYEIDTSEGNVYFGQV